MKKKLVIMLLSTCLLAGCGNASQAVTQSAESTTITPATVDNAKEATVKSVTLAHTDSIKGKVYEEPAQGILSDTGFLLTLSEPCKTGVMRYDMPDGSDFSIMGVKYSAEANMLCFESCGETLTYVTEEQPQIYFINDFSDRVCRFRVKSAEFDESWQYTDEAGFEVLDASALDNEVPFEFGKFSWEQGL